MEWSHSGHSCREWCQTKHLTIGDGISFPIRDEDRQVQCPLGWDPDCNIYPVSRVVATSPFPARKSIPRGFQKQPEGFKIYDRESGNLEPSSIYKYINKQNVFFYYAIQDGGWSDWDSSRNLRQGIHNFNVNSDFGTGKA